MCPAKLEKIFDKIRETPNYQTTRDEKIALFNESNEIENQLEKEKTS